MKASAYPEYLCLLHAAKLLGRPVKWTDERTGSFLSDSHGRDHEVDAELALDAEGTRLAVRLTAYANMGGYLATVAPLMGTGNFVKNVQSQLRDAADRGEHQVRGHQHHAGLAPTAAPGGRRATTSSSG